MRTFSRGMLWTAVMVTGVGTLSACGGSDGKAGANGANAADGGTPGAKGATGATGTKGADGTTGTKGANGTNGTPGATGTVSDSGLATAIDNALNAIPKTGCDALALAVPDDGVQLQMGETLAPGEEDEMVQFVVLKEAININSEENRLAFGAHHALVWTTTYKDKVPTVTTSGNTVDTSGVIHHSGPSDWSTTGWIAGTGTTDNQGAVLPQLPADVAVKVPAGTVVMVDVHMLNATAEPVQACYKVNLHGIPDSAVKHEASTIAWYNVDINVPAKGTAKAHAACPVQQDITLLANVSHMHSRGDGYVANLLNKAPSAGGTKVEELYTGTDWEHPERKVWTGGKKLTKGQWIDWECHYTNPENRNVAQGQNTTNEMCMFIGVYWPKTVEMDSCNTTAVVADGNWRIAVRGAGETLGTGTKTGAEILSCFWASPRDFGSNTSRGLTGEVDRYATQKCITEGCPAATEKWDAYLGCLQTPGSTCQSSCVDAQASFQAVCAITPAAVGGCSEKFGTTGANGTCAADAGPKAVTACNQTAQQSALTKECKSTLCAAGCTADPTAAACTGCIGTFTPTNPPTAGGGTNDTCLNQLSFACVADQGKKIGTACNTACFTDCITKKVTTCTVDCLNTQQCAASYGALAAATCP
jgi:hypothetical protein